MDASSLAAMIDPAMSVLDRVGIVKPLIIKMVEQYVAGTSDGVQVFQ